MAIVPAHAHIHWQSCVNKGLPSINSALPDAIHDDVCGTQGCGVSTPSAAAVAAATCGFARDVHIPKDGMFTPPAASIMVAIVFPSHICVGALVAVNWHGAVPKVHISVAPVVINIAIFIPFL